MKQLRTLLPYIAILIFLFLYLYRAIDTIDYPYWDETYYMRRGLLVMQGNVSAAGLASISTSPLMPLVYAGLYSFVRSANLYPYAVILSVGLLMLGCFLLLRKFLDPTLAAALTMICFVSALPAKFDNISYYFGAAVLWLGLALMGKSPLSRGIGLLVVTIGLYVRPEFIFTVAFLVVVMFIYEIRQLKINRQHVLFTLVAYLPALILILWTVGVVIFESPNSSSRTANAIPWSYANYLRLSGQDSSVDLGREPFEFFERDFGKAETITAQVSAMLTNPQQAVKFLGFNALSIPVTYARSFTLGWTWKNGVPLSNELSVPLITIVFWGAVAVMIGLAVYFYRRDRQIAARSVIALISLFALMTLIPWLILINPDQRTFMTFPLLLVPLGYALTVLYQHWTLPRWLGTVALLGLLVLTPHPFDTVPQVKLKTMLEQIKQNGDSCKVPGYGDTFENLAALEGYVCTH